MHIRTAWDAPSVTSDDLDPLLARRPLREDERSARERAREIDVVLEPIVRPRITAHISACRQALDVIERELDRLIDTLSIDPTARTRAAALWLLLGRCVGQQRAVLLLAEHGMAVEGRPLDRTVKEMTNLVKAMAAEGRAAEKLARQWLADGQAYVKAQAGRRGMTLPFQDREKQVEAFTHLGLDGLSAADKSVYDDLSRAAHGRRSSMLDSFYAPTRHMARGARYALLDQANAVEWASSTTSGVVLAAGAMLLPFRGQEYVASNVLCLSLAIDAIRDTQPLGSEAIAREVGLVRYPFWPAA
jgi:hypothetical protein